MIEGDAPPTTYLKTCSMFRGIQLENIALYLQMSMKIYQLQGLGLGFKFSVPQFPHLENGGSHAYLNALV